MSNRIDKAQKLYAHALRAYEDWQRRGECSLEGFAPENILLRYAAEKTWQAVALAAIELLETYNCPVPEDVMKLHIEIHNLQRRDAEVKRLWIRENFVAIRGTLHTECFYDGEISMPIVGYCITEDANEFLDDVETLINARRGVVKASSIEMVP